MEQFKIKAFGVLAEKLPAAEFKFPYYEDTEQLLNHLKKTYPELQSQKFSLAVDKNLVQQKTGLKGNEEIALLPPFSGG